MIPSKVADMKQATLCLLLLAALSGCDGAYHHADYPLCYDLAPGRRLSAGELSALEHALEHRLLVDFDDDLSFDNPIGPGRCYGNRYDGWPYDEWEIDCPRDYVVVNCSV